MRIDVAGRRRDFFSIPSAARILRDAYVEPSVFKNFKAVQDLIREGRLVSGARGNHAGGAVRGPVSAQSVVSAANGLRDGQVLVLPKSVYVANNQAGRLRNYERSAFVNLDGQPLARQVTGEDRWTDELRNEYRATPQRLLPLALEREQRDALREPLMGYTFGDNLVEWAHLVMGAELRVWQNTFGYDKGIARHEQRLEELVDKEREHGMDFSADRRLHRETVRLYEDRKRRYGIDEEIEVLADAGHFCLDDVIEPDGRPGLRQVWYGQHKSVHAPAHWRMDVFRRTDPDSRRVIAYDNFPVVPPRFSSVTPALLYKMRVSGDSGHEIYANLAQRGHPWTAEAIAGAHTIARIVEKADDLVFYDFQESEKGSRFRSGRFAVAQMPFALATREGTSFADVIRYRTVFLSEDADGRVVSDSANLATFSKLFGAKLLVDGYGRSLATKHELYARGEDPMEYAVRLEYDEMNP